MRRIGPLAVLGLAFLALSPAAPAQVPTPAVKAPTALTSAEMKEAEAAIKAYLEAPTWAKKREIAARLEAIDHPSKQDIAKLAQKAFAMTRRLGPAVKDERKRVCTHPDFPGHYLLDVPGKAKQGKPVGVFIALHGGGAGVGEGAQIEGLFGKPMSGMIHVYPTVIEKEATAWNTEREEQYVLAILDELKRTFAVDTNRVYLAGHSMGGYGTWSIGPRHADLFAAISPQAGGVFVMGGGAGGKVEIADGIVSNLKNLPIWFYNSTDDPQVRPDSSIRAAERLEELKAEFGAFDFVWKKYTDIGHGTPKEGLGEIWKWMLTKKRDPLPAQVLWEPTRTYKRHFYWLRHADPGSGRYDVKRDGNRFTVASGGSGLTLMVNEKMVKFDQPVTVVDAEGKELFQGRVPYSLLPMIESIDAKRDPELWFSGWIRLP